MISRCCRVSHEKYQTYGAVGVRVCDRWRYGDGTKSGFECFLDDLGEKPTKQHSLDRINSDGNYEPSNCRWATRQQQISNRRCTFRNAAGYFGVRPQKDKWRAQLMHDGVRRNLGTFATAELAARAYDDESRRLYGTDAVLNFTSTNPPDRSKRKSA